MNVNNIIASVDVIDKVSKKSGNEYTVLEVKFKNGYVITQFLNTDQKYIINMMIDNKIKR